MESFCTSTTERPNWISMPISVSFFAVYVLTFSGKGVSSRGAMSTRRTRMFAGSIRSPSLRTTIRISSAIAPDVSTPVGPPPTTTNVRVTGFPSSASTSADSRVIRSVFLSFLESESE